MGRSSDPQLLRNILRTLSTDIEKTKMAGGFFVCFVCLFVFCFSKMVFFLFVCLLVVFFFLCVCFSLGWWCLL